MVEAAGEVRAVGSRIQRSSLAYRVSVERSGWLPAVKVSNLALAVASRLW